MYTLYLEQYLSLKSIQLVFINKHLYNLVVYLVCFSQYSTLIQTRSERDGKTERMRERESEVVREGEREREGVLLFGGLTSLRLTEADASQRLLFECLLPKNRNHLKAKPENQ